MARESSACTIIMESNSANTGHVLLHLVGVEMRELVDAGVQQEAFEAEHAIVVQAAQIAGIAGDRAAPETDVDV